MKMVIMHKAEWAEIIEALYIAAAVYTEDAQVLDKRNMRRPAQSLRDLATRARARAKRIAEAREV